MKSRFMYTILLMLMTLAGTLCQAAEFAVIVHKSNDASITKENIKNLYMARSTSFSNGAAAIPINQKETSSVKEAFDLYFLEKNREQIIAYWSKMIFTGRAAPIKQLDNDQEVLEAIATTPNAIGYISTTSVTDSVKVLMEF